MGGRIVKQDGLLIGGSMMRQFALSNSSVSRTAAKETPVGFLRLAAFSFVALVLIALTMTPLSANAQLSGKGAIAGTVTDQTGAVIPDAVITATDNANVFQRPPNPPGPVPSIFPTWIQASIQSTSPQKVSKSSSRRISR
jgi:hypothetical protein